MSIAGDHVCVPFVPCVPCDPCDLPVPFHGTITYITIYFYPVCMCHVYIHGTPSGTLSMEH